MCGVMLPIPSYTETVTVIKQTQKKWWWGGETSKNKYFREKWLTQLGNILERRWKSI